MKKFREEYIVDTFVTDKGEKKNFVMAAISCDLQDCEVYGDIEINERDDEFAVPVNKCLVFGLSVCDPRDAFDEELGKRIAKGKALKAKSRFGVIFSSKPGMINSEMVKATLLQEATFFKSNPEAYIAGYKKKADGKSK